MQSKLDRELCHESKKRTLEMLTREPSAAKLVLRAFWKKLRRDKLPLFESAWMQLEPHAPLFALDAEYQEWETHANHFKGMRQKQSRRKHGIARAESMFFVSESTYKFDKLHGLQIKISLENVAINFYQMGARLAGFVFNGDFVEIKREDAEGLLAEWNPSHF